MTVLLITCAALPGLHADDRRLLVALRDRGIAVAPAVWEDRYVEWDAADLCVTRSAWDYAYRRTAFLHAMQEIADQTTLWNSFALTQWNTHKQYLCDLADRRVPVVPTQVLPAGSPADLASVLEACGWSQAVIKAAVGQSGRHVLKVDARDVDLGQEHLDRLQPAEDLLLQPYIRGVEDTGELSVVIVDGEITHAVRKRAEAGDFRVHSDYGGSVVLEDPPPASADVALAAVGSLPEPVVYARVDLVEDPERGPLVMELEVVEPELFFAQSDRAIERFAAAVERFLQ